MPRSLLFPSRSIDDRQHLQVTLEVSGNFYEIRTWQTITDTDWESDDSIQLLPID